MPHIFVNYTHRMVTAEKTDVSSPHGASPSIARLKSMGRTKTEKRKAGFWAARRAQIMGQSDDAKNDDNSDSGSDWDDD